MNNKIRRKWIIAAFAIFAIVGAYYGIRAVAKNEYENQIDDKIDGVCCDRFFEAISVSYPFLWQSATTVRSRAVAIKSLASQAGYDRYSFSVLWRQYQKTPECIQESKILYDTDFFTSSNVYGSLTHTGKSFKKESFAVINLIRAAKLVRNISEIVEITSIMNAANEADSICLDFISEMSQFQNKSHSINDWRTFEGREFDIKIANYSQLRKEPFSLYNYIFNNPLN